MWRVLFDWLHWGSEQEINYTLKRKILHCNVGALLVLGSMAAYAGAFLISGNRSLIKIVYLQIPFFLSVAAVPWLNRKGWSNLARWDLALSVIAIQSLAVIWVWGSFQPAYDYFVLFAVAPVLFFPISQWPGILFLFVLNMGIYTYFRTHAIEVPPLLLDLEPSTVELLRSSFIGTTLLILLWTEEMVAESNERKLQQLSLTDALTELPNRRSFELQFQRELDNGGRDGTPLVLAVMDIDHFKMINDQYGHDVGDQVLKYLAQQLQRASRATNMLARMGGEEFALLMPRTHLAEGRSAAERLRQGVASGQFLLSGQALKLSISIGLVALDGRMTMNEAYRLADQALYLAKRHGRNRVEVHGDRGAGGEPRAKR